MEEAEEWSERRCGSGRTVQKCTSTYTAKNRPVVDANRGAPDAAAAREGVIIMALTRP